MNADLSLSIRFLEALNADLRARVAEQVIAELRSQWHYRAKLLACGLAVLVGTFVLDWMS